MATVSLAAINGTIAAITNNLDTGRSTAFQFDPMDRVTSAATQATSGSDCWGQSFTADPLSNLTTMNVTQCSAWALSTGANSNNQLTSAGFTYDAAGNMTADGANTYTFDAENRIISAAGVSYLYDGNNLRVEKSSGTLYWRGTSGDVLAETDLNGNTVAEYVFFAGRRVARLNSSGNAYFYYTDPLGNTRTMTDASGNVCYDADFTPYGTEINHANSCPQNYKFVGYERDPETGLDYAFARYYNPRLGRFMSVDPLPGSTTDPQSLNRYAYVANRSLAYTDPSGMNCARIRDIDGNYRCYGRSDAGEIFGFNEFDLLFFQVEVDIPALVPGEDGSLANGVEGIVSVYANLDLLAFFGDPNASPAPHPCFGIDPSQFDYSSANGRQHIEERHMVWMNDPGQPMPMDQLPDGTFRAAGQYLFDNPGTKDQNFSLVKQINAATFNSVTAYPAASGGNLVFKAALPPQTTNGLYPPLRQYIGEGGVPSRFRMVRFQPTNVNLLVLKPDCKTVVTSYPVAP